MSLEASDNDNNQPAMGAPKAGGGLGESVDDHKITMAGDAERRERAADDEGSDKEGKGGKGDGDDDEGGGGGRRARAANEGGVQRRGGWQQGDGRGSVRKNVIFFKLPLDQF